MADWSVRNQNEGGQRMADVLLRAAGGTTAMLLVSPVVGDATDAGQIGLDAPGFQAVAISPVIFRRTRPVMTQGKAAEYELIVSASAVAAQVGLLELDSAEALFGMVAGVNVAGLALEIEGWGCSIQMGQPVLYRLMLGAAAPEAAAAQS